MGLYSPEAIKERVFNRDQASFMQMESKIKHQKKTIALAVLITPLVCGGLGYLAYRFIPLLLQLK